MKQKILILSISLIIILFDSCVQGKKNKLNEFPTIPDNLLLSINTNLDKQRIDDENAKQIFNLGETSFYAKEYEKSKNIFLNIIGNDTSKLYNQNHYYSSDLGGVKTDKLQGYGSFSLNYKNKAAIYLTQIYIEEQSFDKALKYISLADKVYSIQYNCGTGHRSYNMKLKYLYALSYKGLKQYDKAIEKILPDCFDWQLSSTFIKIVKEKYSKEELLQEMDNALKNFEFTQDLTYTEVHVTRNSGNENQNTTIEKYLLGKASINFFDYKLELPKMSLENGQIATKKMCIKDFKQSNFYKELTGKKFNDQNIFNQGTINLKGW
jgi:hypothetical protein